MGTARFEDPENARIIQFMAGGLALVAVLVAVGTVWWWRSTKVEHPALGPLEVMGSRSWWKGDYTTRRSRLEAVRPAAEPVEGAVDAIEAVDLDAVRRGSPPQFDDLADGPPVVHADALAGASAADLDALLAAAGAAIASAHAADSVGNDSPAAVVESVVESDVESAAVEETEADDAPLVAAEDPTVAVEGARAPIDPLLRVRTD